MDFLHNNHDVFFAIVKLIGSSIVVTILLSKTVVVQLFFALQFLFVPHSGIMQLRYCVPTSLPCRFS